MNTTERRAARRSNYPLHTSFFLCSGLRGSQGEGTRKEALAGFLLRDLSSPKTSSTLGQTR